MVIFETWKTEPKLGPGQVCSQRLRTPLRWRRWPRSHPHAVQQLPGKQGSRPGWAGGRLLGGQGQKPTAVSPTPVSETAVEVHRTCPGVHSSHGPAAGPPLNNTCVDTAVTSHHSPKHRAVLGSHGSEPGVSQMETH